MKNLKKAKRKLQIKADSEAKVAELEQKLTTLENTDLLKLIKVVVDCWTIYARGNVIKSSKSKMFQGLRTRKFSEGEKKLFIEFVYYSTYAFYHVFQKNYE